MSDMTMGVGGQRAERVERIGLIYIRCCHQRPISLGASLFPTHPFPPHPSHIRSPRPESAVSNVLFYLCLQSIVVNFSMDKHSCSYSVTISCERGVWWCRVGMMDDQTPARIGSFAHSWQHGIADPLSDVSKIWHFFYSQYPQMVYTYTPPNHISLHLGRFLVSNSIP